MPLTRKEKVVWFLAALLFHGIVAFCIFKRHGFSNTISGWRLGIIIFHLSVFYVPIMKIYVGLPIVLPNFVRAMEAVGWLGTALYFAILFGLLTFFCWLMLLRPVASDLGIHYASSTLPMTMSIRDYGLNHVRTWASGFVCVVLVVIRLVAEMVAVPVLPQPAIEEAPRRLIRLRWRGLILNKTPKQVAVFLNILAHHEKNRSVKVDYIRSGWSVSRAFNECLRAILKLTPVLLVKPNPGCLGALDGTYISIRVEAIYKPRYNFSAYINHICTD
ncbi:hypothetical protein H5410_048705 [Solanum commersonii]|uniref:Uncharacterized protein n=1 Tax=Solanum commersonii TaxID=4109 RepID=A0A9J5XL93_SOLCO|nr:hypothetical protein H5410_048705 [Solanum commersonii]